MSDWVNYINEQIRIYNIPATHVANFDETNLDFGLEPKKTLDYVGVRTVKATSSGSSQRCTAMLGCTLSGEKITPFLIFKGKRGGRIHKKELQEPTGYATNLEYSVQINAWMDEENMHDWITTVWEPFVKFCRGPTLLIMDAFKAHLVASVKKGW